MKTRSCIFLPLLVALPLFSTESVNWDTVNNTVTYSTTISSVTAGTTEGFSLSQFSSSAAATAEGVAGTYTLIQVVISINGIISGTFSYENKNDFSATVTQSQLMNTGFTATMNGVSANDSYSYQVPGTPFSIAANTTEYRNYSNLPGTQGSATITTDLAAFTGDGTIAGTVKLKASQYTETDAAVYSGVTASGNATVSIMYYYTVPEPNTLALAAIGCTALLLRRRSRATKKD